MRPIYFLLLFLPIAVVAELLHWPPLAIFAASALAVIPLAGLLGEATEVLAEKVGPRFGGLLNATLGNAAELIITIIAIRAGQLDLVKASLIGSVLGNILLVLGFSILLGGLKHGVQRFNRDHAGMDATMLILAVIAISVPSIFNAAIEPDTLRVEELSLTTAAVMLVIYALSIVYMLRTKAPDKEHGPGGVQPSHTGHRWSPAVALGILGVSVLGIAVMSEFLVGSIEPVTESLGLTPFFVGIIIIPLIGNVAEHLVAVQVALKNQMDLSLSIANGSSLQIALFVAPVLVFLSLALGNPLTLEFNNFELIALTASGAIAAFIAVDGRSNWLEGAMLLAVYVILALAFFFLPFAG
ncbi:MAG TPA: calcium/proton exchanger [Anaerolineae bacterium]|nr:calcium/proton exchanger [Anaerolineae bacterium]